MNCRLLDFMIYRSFLIVNLVLPSGRRDRPKQIISRILRFMLAYFSRLLLGVPAQHSGVLNRTGRSPWGGLPRPSIWACGPRIVTKTGLNRWRIPIEWRTA